MPIKIQGDLPAKEILELENIFVMDENRAMHQDIRPISIAILNLMPLKEETELQILRSLSNTPLQVDVSFLMVSSHQSTHTSMSHLNKFYQTFDEVKEQNFDGLIITGAPVEQMEFEEVDYWEELCEIMEWSKSHVTSTLHLCWGAQAALHYHYSIDKHPLDKKMFGVFAHNVMNRRVPLVRGFDDVFFAPHSRHTEIRREDIESHSDLKILAESEEAGVFLVISDDGKQIYVMGLRNSEPVAHFLSFYLQMIRGNVTLLTTSSTTEFFEQMIRIGKDDVFIGIGFPRYSMRTLKAMEFANDRKAGVIAITDNEHSPMKMYSTCNLFAATDSSTFIDSMVAPMSLINALLTAICIKKPKEIQKHLKTLEQTWNTYQVYLNDEIDFIGDDPVIKGNDEIIS